jgi:pyruvate dehydrogenase E2 component (dihydrolipoamide acetyltransferase)
MAVEFQMPKLGLTMEEGLILDWLVPDGAEVTEGMPVLMVQTDKVDTEVEAPGAGRLVRTGAVGDTFACGVQIGWLLAPGETAPTSGAPAGGPDASAAPTAAPALTAMAATAMPVIHSVAPGRRFVSPNARRVAAELGVELSLVHGSGPGGRVVSEDVEAAHAAGVRGPVASAPSASRAPGINVLASFAATSLADLIGIDLREVPTSSDRIERDDVVRHIRALIARGGSTPIPVSAASGPASALTPAPAAKVEPLAAALQPPTSVTPMTGMRGVIAQRMHKSLTDMAQLTLTMDVEMGHVVAHRTARKQAGGATPGYTDYVIAATAQALKLKPYANSQIVAEGVALLPEVHVGMAVALDNGLVVPVIRNTAALSIDELSAETTRLATAARAGKLKLAELEGGTFSVTALGMFGVDAFTPFINPTNTAILGVGRIRDDLAWDAKGKPVKASRLTLSLTWDHRAFDGAPAAEFCAQIKSLLEDPATFP